MHRAKATNGTMRGRWRVEERQRKWLSGRRRDRERTRERERKIKGEKQPERRERKNSAEQRAN